MKIETSMLPAKPGVYLLKNKQGRIIYIGKSVNIKNRVKTHFKARPVERILQPFTAETASVDYIITANEPEALIKESELIKKHKPRYNIMLRDDKQYFYVVFSQDKLPVLSITHRPPRNCGAAGPFTDGKSLKIVLRYLRKAFPYYTQKHRKLPCSYCQIGLCPGPPPKEALGEARPDRGRGGNPFIKEYRKNIAKIKDVLNSKRPRVLSALKKAMTQYAKNLNFEKAAKARDQIKALENVFAHYRSYETYKTCMTYVTYKSLEAYDISNIQGREPVASMIRFDNGKPNKSMYRRFSIRLPERPDDYAMIREAIKRRLAHPEWPYPDVFLIDGGRGQLNAAIQAGAKGVVIALAKRFNELYIPGRKNPIPLSELPEQTKNLLMHARDEAHRFAISYHRQLHRRRNML